MCRIDVFEYTVFQIATWSNFLHHPSEWIKTGRSHSRQLEVKPSKIGCNEFFCSTLHSSVLDEIGKTWSLYHMNHVSKSTQWNFITSSDLIVGPHLVWFDHKASTNRTPSPGPQPATKTRRAMPEHLKGRDSIHILYMMKYAWYMWCSQCQKRIRDDSGIRFVPWMRGLNAWWKYKKLSSVRKDCDYDCEHLWDWFPIVCCRPENEDSTMQFLL